MKDINQLIALLFCTFALHLQFVQAQAEAVPAYPTSTVLTEKDVTQINEEGTLHNRPVNWKTSWSKAESRWSGLPVFLGVRSEIVRWFESGQEGYHADSGFRDVVPLSRYHYALLIRQLLAIQDSALRETVLRYAYSTGSYPRLEFERLAVDPSLSLEAQIAAWHRANEDDLVRKPAEAIGTFWRLFGARLNSEVLLELACNWKRFPWQVFRFKELEPKPLSDEQAQVLLLPLLRREYLSYLQGGFVRLVLTSLINSSSDREIWQATIVAHLEAWDKAVDERSLLLWEYLPQLEALPDPLAQKLKHFAFNARTPEHAAAAFYGYLKTPEGKKELGEAQTAVSFKDARSAYLQAWLKRAFEFPPEKAAEFIRALRIRAKSNWTGAQVWPLAEFMQDAGMQLRLTHDHLQLLKQALEVGDPVLQYFKEE